MKKKLQCCVLWTKKLKKLKNMIHRIFVVIYLAVQVQDFGLPKIL